MTANAPVIPGTLVWRLLHWPLPLDADKALAVLRAFAVDQHSPRLILETRATTSHVAYLLGGTLPGLLSAQHKLRVAIPELRSSELTHERTPVILARRLRLSTFHRPLHADKPEQVVRHVLGALSQVRDDELLVLQLMLGPRRIPLAVPNNSPSSTVMPWWQILLLGNGGQVDGEKRAALREKVSDHGCAATIRLGVHAASAVRRRE